MLLHRLWVIGFIAIALTGCKFNQPGSPFHFATMESLSSTSICTANSHQTCSIGGVPGVQSCDGQGESWGSCLVPTTCTGTGTLSQKAAAAHNGDITIGANECILIDQDLDVDLITVNGKLVCPQKGAFSLKVTGIDVEGDDSLFECGRPTQRFLGHLTVNLKSGAAENMGTRRITAMAGATIRLYGDGTRAGWQKIRAPIAAGDSTVLVNDGSSWQVGDRIVVGPTSFDHTQSEERFVASIDTATMTVQVDQPFKYNHYGNVQTYATAHPVNAPALDERAEIADLTRNIVIQPDGTDADLDAAQFGGHIMMMEGTFAYVDGVELVRMGQMGEMGRYPFHWHLAGDVPGQFIANSVIRNSYQRCVTIHGTRQALVQNNVCFNHFGHGFFLENGSEINNSIIGNLSMGAKKMPQAKALLISDVTTSDPTRFAASSGFWISNPNNTVRDNVASGEEGSGFWMAFDQKLVCDGDDCTVPCSGSDASVAGACISAGNVTANLTPAFQPTNVFANNVAHGATVGMVWDGAPDGPLTTNANMPKRNPRDRVIVASHYSVPLPSPVFDNLSVFKNRYSGIYFRGNSVVFNHLMAADNFDSLFFAYNQVVANSIIVGLSDNTTSDDLTYLSQNGQAPQPIQGIRLYDGPFDLRNVLFAGFPSSPTAVGTWDATPVPFFPIGGAGRYIDSVSGITFSPEPVRRVATGALNLGWQDTSLTSVIRDLDGSLAGDPGALIVEDQPLLRDPSCKATKDAGINKCHYDLGIVDMEASAFDPYFSNQVPMTIERSDGPSVTWDGKQFFSKFGVIESGAYSYRVTLLARPRSLSVQLESGNRALLSPVIEIAGLDGSCYPYDATVGTSGQMMSYAELAGAGAINGGVAYARDASGRLFIRLASTRSVPFITSTNGASGYSGPVEFVCPPPQNNPLLDPTVFDPSWYLNHYPDLSAAFGVDLNAATNHWLGYGIHEGRQGSQEFWSTEYSEMYPDLATAFGTNYAAMASHFVQTGLYEGRFGRIALRQEVFSPVFYLQNYPDLTIALGAVNIAGAIQHWLANGINEGRQATAGFSSVDYLAMYPDIQKAYGATNYAGAVDHYVLCGMREGRAGSALVDPVVFDANWYLNKYPDLMAAFGAGNVAQAQQHWLSYGIKEGRQGSATFWSVSYLKSNPDVAKAYGATNYAGAIEHYVRYGMKEGRSGF